MIESDLETDVGPKEHADSGQVRYIWARAVSFAGTTVCGDQFRV
jgi:hypothetical protein